MNIKKGYEIITNKTITNKQNQNEHNIDVSSKLKFNLTDLIELLGTLNI